MKCRGSLRRTRDSFSSNRCSCNMHIGLRFYLDFDTCRWRIRCRRSRKGIHGTSRRPRKQGRSILTRRASVYIDIDLGRRIILSKDIGRCRRWYKGRRLIRRRTIVGLLCWLLLIGRRWHVRRGGCSSRWSSSSRIERGRTGRSSSTVKVTRSRRRRLLLWMRFCHWTISHIPTIGRSIGSTKSRQTTSKRIRASSSAHTGWSRMLSNIISIPRTGRRRNGTTISMSRMPVLFLQSFIRTGGMKSIGLYVRSALGFVNCGRRTSGSCVLAISRGRGRLLSRSRSCRWLCILS